MKLGFLFLSDQKMGGVYQYSLSTIECLIKNKKIKELIIYTNDKNFNDDRVNVIYIENYNILFICSCFTGFFNFFPRYLFRDLDFIFSPTYSPLLFFSQSKVVFTLHDLQEIYYPQNFNRITLMWRKYIYSKMVKISSKIITESSFVKQDIIKHKGFNKKDIHVIESPPFFDKFSSKEDTELEFKLYSKIRYDYVFFPAQFWKHKNHSRVLRAFSLLSKEKESIKIILTGNKNKEYRSIKKLIQEINIQDKVIFMHKIPQKFMSFFFKNALFTIAPTLHESISIPVFEAFQYRSPVCASGILAIKDQVSEAGLLFDPTSIDDIYKCMFKLLIDKELREKLKLKGVERNNFFSSDRFNKKFNQVI